MTVKFFSRAPGRKPGRRPVQAAILVATSLGLATTALATELLRGLPTDWASVGLDDGDLDDLADLMLRLIGSWVQHPPATPRPAEEVRRQVLRWIGPAVGDPRGGPPESRG